MQCAENPDESNVLNFTHEAGINLQYARSLCRTCNGIFRWLCSGKRARNRSSSSGGTNPRSCESNSPRSGEGKLQVADLQNSRHRLCCFIWLNFSIWLAARRPVLKGACISAEWHPDHRPLDSQRIS